MAVRVTHTSKLEQWSTNSRDKSKIIGEEWEIEGFEILLPSEPLKKCFCRRETRNICYIRNTSTDKKVQVALECAGEFREGTQIHKFLKSVPKIFEGCSRILDNLSNPASRELVEFAHTKCFFTQANKTFYDEHAQYTYGSLPVARQKYRKDLNKLLIAMVSSAKLAFKSLNDKQTNIAAPRLIEYAFEKEVLNSEQKQSYLNLWKRVNIPSGQYQSLSGDQKKRLIYLNERMITGLKSELLCLPNGQQQLSAFFGQPTKRSGGTAILGSPPLINRKRKRYPKG